MLAGRHLTNLIEQPHEFNYYHYLCRLFYGRSLPSTALAYCHLHDVGRERESSRNMNQTKLRLRPFIDGKV